MDQVYYRLIIQGSKAYSDVPKALKKKVKTLLEDNGYGDLAVE